MIYGIGTDLVAVDRLRTLWVRHGEAALSHLLASSEREAFACASDPGRFLAKRFAAKEAFAKALGTGLRVPATLTAIAVDHDALGKPILSYADSLAQHMAGLGLVAHLSISDEAHYALAFVILERV